LQIIIVTTIVLSVVITKYIITDFKPFDIFWINYYYYLYFVLMVLEIYREVLRDTRVLENKLFLFNKKKIDPLGSYSNMRITQLKKELN
jgi:hypothetical protein